MSQKSSVNCGSQCFLYVFLSLLGLLGIASLTIVRLCNNRRTDVTRIITTEVETTTVTTTATGTGDNQSFIVTYSNLHHTSSVHEGSLPNEYISDLNTARIFTGSRNVPRT